MWQKKCEKYQPVDGKGIKSK